MHQEPGFGRLLEAYGQIDPFVWHDGGRTGTSNFAALLVHIAGQRISAVAAFAVYDRIARLTDGIPTPEQVTDIGFTSLRATGLSDAKTRYIVSLAEAQTAGAIDVEHMDDLDDAEVERRLTALPGLGPWSAQMFLIRQLHRPDVLPAGDVVIRGAVQRLFDLPARPGAADVAKRAETWSPHRTYAAALLWRSSAAPGELADPKERAIARESVSGTRTTERPPP